jgi:hypothetical protein
MAIVTKAIKPDKIKLDAFRLETLTGMNEVGAAIKRDFHETTKTWKNKPFFDVVKSLRGGNLELMVATDDEIYMYVNDGTRPHKIRPKAGNVLIFQSGYFAKTVPNVIDSQPGGSFGPVIGARSVNHPGTKARNFDKIIAKKFQPRFKRRMEEAMRRAVKKSGHAITVT